MHLALSEPWLLERVMIFLGNGDRAACMSVSKGWKSIAFEVLWRTWTFDESPASVKRVNAYNTPPLDGQTRQKVQPRHVVVRYAVSGFREDDFIMVDILLVLHHIAEYVISLEWDSSNTKFTVGGCTVFLSHAAHLRRLVFGSCSDAANIWLSHLLRASTNLEVLSFQAVSLEGPKVTLPAGLGRSLTTLDCNFDAVADLSAITGYQALREFNALGLPASSFDILKHLPHLSVLSLSYSERPWDAVTSVLTSIGGRLDYLRVSAECDYFVDIETLPNQVVEAIVRHCGNLKGLELNCFGTCTCAGVYGVISALPKLKALGLVASYVVPDKDWKSRLDSYVADRVRGLSLFFEWGLVQDVAMAEDQPGTLIGGYTRGTWDANTPLGGCLPLQRNEYPKWLDKARWLSGTCF
ncbi:hypothetical protein HDU93_004395 [Gonapodya sp. JEL0774]|nr:hypothetical protein HDU93_004395 [Gonapodya sp. JEL0774]